MRLFEVDTPATQGAKKQALERAGIDAAHVTFVETNFGQTSWLDALMSRGFDPALPTFVLWEGVTMYLDEETVQTTLRRVAALPTGSRIAFDTFSRELVRAESPFRLLGRLVKFAMRFYGESWVFGISTRAAGREQVNAFLTSYGLELAVFEPMGKVLGVPIGGFTLAARSG